MNGKIDEKVKKSTEEAAKKVTRTAAQLLIACLYVPVVLIGVARAVEKKKFWK